MRADYSTLGGLARRGRDEFSGRSLAEVLPDPRLEVIPGASHNVPMDKLASVLADFLVRERAIIHA